MTTIRGIHFSERKADVLAAASKAEKQYSDWPKSLTTEAIEAEINTYSWWGIIRDGISEACKTDRSYTSHEYEHMSFHNGIQQMTMPIMRSSYHYNPATVDENYGGPYRTFLEDTYWKILAECALREEIKKQKEQSKFEKVPLAFKFFKPYVEKYIEPYSWLLFSTILLMAGNYFCN